MASYGGITFYVVAESSNNQIVFKDWDQHDDGAIVRTKIPYADAEYTQYVGRGNDTLALKVEILSDTDFTSLKGLRGDMTPRTLVDPFGLGNDYQNVLLQRVYDVERVTYQEEWHATLLFERVKSL